MQVYLYCKFIQLNLQHNKRNQNYLNPEKTDKQRQGSQKDYEIICQTTGSKKINILKINDRDVKKIKVLLIERLFKKSILI